MTFITEFKKSELKKMTFITELKESPVWQEIVLVFKDLQTVIEAVKKFNHPASKAFLIICLFVGSFIVVSLTVALIIADIKAFEKVISLF